ncbi:hypothetical protein PRZ03_23710, partial [Paucibacter sp. hw8]|nr:hypothetical protein [Roseateles albus]
MEPPTGKGRYYNGLLQFMALLHVSRALSSSLSRADQSTLAGRTGQLAAQPIRPRRPCAPPAFHNGAATIHRMPAPPLSRYGRGGRNWSDLQNSFCRSKQLKQFLVRLAVMVRIDVAKPSGVPSGRPAA